MLIAFKILTYDQAGYELFDAGINVRDENEIFVDGYINPNHVTYLNRHGYKDDRVEIGLLSGPQITVLGTLEEVMKSLRKSSFGVSLQ